MKIMPEIFRDSTSNLFESARWASLNKGEPINEKQWEPPERFNCINAIY